MPEMDSQVSMMLFGVTQSVVGAAVLFLGKYLFQNNAKIAVMENQLQAHGVTIRANSEYIHTLNQTISELNTTLAVLNEQLKMLERNREVKD